MSSSTSFLGKRYNISNVDIYSTPQSITESLFKRERFDGIVFEPACGEGEMVKVIEKHNKCIASDIRKDINGFQNVDFLKYNFPMENLITNPPYNLANEFVVHGLNYFEKKMAFLLRLNFLESQRRYKLFKESPLKSVYVFSKRQTLTPKGFPTKKHGTITYAWFVWEKVYSGVPQLDWICD